MRPIEGRIESVKPWDGELKDGDKAIIVHDVLVSASQINHVYDHVLQTVEIKGVFCLVTRTDQSAKGKTILAENKRRLYQVLETDDNAITVLRHQKKDR
jgi:orotate phosphoribosyltransferase